MTLQPRLDHMAPALDVGALGYSHSFLTNTDSHKVFSTVFG